MTYQVLARKWRPRSFATLVGQDHVVRALSHALDTGRLHHAWLFTGTRGVGKTTISRILAKALNCEQGVSATPCNECAACTAIDADRFPDYVEMDAASNRGVDDMAALLDQAVYAPVAGRYKVYMIDEVHMLTGHAFNAMLKTLEEPPAHVKFILATTDPQKIPVTVLSRCLQFNLKQMAPAAIVGHLTRLLEAEQVPFEPAALRPLAEAAGGSMRDALSLLDQAIAHGAGKLSAEQVTGMLGTVGEDHLFELLDHLRAGDVPAMLAVADAMQGRSLSFDAALQALASLFHRLAVAQFAPGAIADADELAQLTPHAAAFDAEFVQLAYQICIHCRDELPLAPDEYAGFTMALLRLAAFCPQTPGGAPQGGSVPPRATPQPPSAAQSSDDAAPPSAAPAPQAAKPTIAPAPIAPAPSAAVPASAEPALAAALVPAKPSAESPAPVAVPAPRTPPVEAAPASADEPPPWLDIPPDAMLEAVDEAEAQARGEDDAGFAPQPASEAASAPVQNPAPVSAAVPDSERDEVAAELEVMLAGGDWHAAIKPLRLRGMELEFARHAELRRFVDDVLVLGVAPEHAHFSEACERFGAKCSRALGRKIRVTLEVSDLASVTLAQQQATTRAARHREAVALLEQDELVQALVERFGAHLIETSVRPQ